MGTSLEHADFQWKMLRKFMDNGKIMGNDEKNDGNILGKWWKIIGKWCENDVKCWECGGETDGDAHFIDEPSTEKRGAVGHLWWGEACANVLNMFTYAIRMATMMSFNLGTKDEYGIHGFKWTSDNCESIIVQGGGNLIRINSCDKAFHGVPWFLMVFVASGWTTKGVSSSMFQPWCRSWRPGACEVPTRKKNRHVFRDVFFHLELWLGSPAWDKAKPCCRSSCGYNSVVSWKEVGAQQSLGRVSRNAPRSPRSHSFSSFCGSEYVIFHLIYDFSELKWEHQLFGYTYIYIYIHDSCMSTNDDLKWVSPIITVPFSTHFMSIATNYHHNGNLMVIICNKYGNVL